MGQGGLRGLCERWDGCGCEEIYRIPDAVVFKEAPSTCQYSHGHCAHDAAFDAGHEWRDFHGKAHAVAALTDFKVFDRTGGGMWLRRFLKRNGEVFWMRKNIQEPACESGNTDKHANESDEETGHQTGEKQHQSESRNDRPCGGFGNFDKFWVFRVGSIHCGTRTLRM